MAFVPTPKSVALAAKVDGTLSTNKNRIRRIGLFDGSFEDMLATNIVSGQLGMRIPPFSSLPEPFIVNFAIRFLMPLFESENAVCLVPLLLPIAFSTASDKLMIVQYILPEHVEHPCLMQKLLLVFFLY